MQWDIFSHEKEGKSDTGYHMEEPRNDYMPSKMCQIQKDDYCTILLTRGMHRAQRRKVAWKVEWGWGIGSHCLVATRLLLGTVRGFWA